MYRLKNSCRILYSAAIVCGLMIIVACAPGNVRVNEIVPSQMELLEHHSGLIELQVKGGRDSHELSLPQIPNVDFVMALKTAIEQSQVFSQVTEKGNAEYRLEAVIFNLSQPMFAKGDVSLEVAYILSLISTGEVLWQEAITTVGNGMVSDNASYDKRVATEQAVNENIKTAIERLSRVSLKRL